MKFPKNLIVLMGITCIVLVLFGCGIRKDEHEKIVSELYKTKIENDKNKADLTKSKKELAKTKTDLDNIKAELDATGAELNNTKEDLDKTKMELKLANTEFGEMEKKFNEAQRLLEIDLEKQIKEKQAIKAQFNGARQETVSLREELGELINRLMKTVEELNLIQDANKALHAQIDELIIERNRLQELTEK